MTITGRLAVFPAFLLAVSTMSEPLFEGDTTHATRGTVKTAAATEITVARPKNRGDITITLSPSTHVDGDIRVGATVSVRYHDDHGRHVATAVAVERPQSARLTGINFQLTKASSGRDVIVSGRDTGRLSKTSPPKPQAMAEGV